MEFCLPTPFGMKKEMYMNSFQWMGGRPVSWTLLRKQKRPELQALKPLNTRPTCVSNRSSGSGNAKRQRGSCASQHVKKVHGSPDVDPPISR